jgi:hypothetical protein
MMKYFEALKIYNDGKPAWCSPRKGTEKYKKVIAIMNGKSPKSPKHPKSPPKHPKSSPKSSPKSPKSSPKSSPKPLFKRSNIVKLLLSVR